MAHHFEVGLGMDDLRRAAAAVSSLLDAQLDEGDSEHYGGFYLRGRSGDGKEIFVFRNFDPIEDEWNAPDDRDLPVIVKVFNSDRPANALAVDLERALGSAARVLGEHVG